jgi:CheY-like chemotaxis protein
MERERYSAIIADIMMPGMDGLSFIKALRQDRRFKDLCVVAVTALAMSGDRQKAMAAGFNDYLVKPIAPSEIVAVVRRCLSRPSGDSPPTN